MKGPASALLVVLPLLALAEPQVAVQSNVPGHDIIICPAALPSTTLCFANNRSQHETPYQFAGNAGYRTVHHLGAIVSNGFVFITIEVSK